MKAFDSVLTRWSLTLLLSLTATLQPLCANTAGGDTVTVAIECPDGVVDDDWDIEIEILDANGKLLGTVTQAVPKHTTSKAAANGLKDQINEKFNAGAKAQETNHNYWKDKKPQAEDLVLPAGFCVGKVTTKKLVGGAWKKRIGHLKLFRGEDRINNPTKKPAKRGTSTLELEGNLSLSPGVVPGEVTPLQRLDLAIGGSEVETLVVELHLWGFAEEGEVHLRHMAQYPAGTPIEIVVSDLAQFALNEGFGATMSGGGRQVQIDFGSSPHFLTAWSFSAYGEGADCDTPPNETSEPTPLTPLGVTFSAMAH